MSSRTQTTLQAVAEDLYRAGWVSTEQYSSLEDALFAKQNRRQRVEAASVFAGSLLFLLLYTFKLVVAFPVEGAESFVRENWGELIAVGFAMVLLALSASSFIRTTRSYAKWEEAISQKKGEPTAPQ